MATVAEKLEAGRDLWLKVVMVLNLLDMVFTLYFVELGMATEANPLLASALDVSPLLFGATKMSVLFACLMALNKTDHKMVLVAVKGLAVVYGAVVGYHLLHV